MFHLFKELIFQVETKIEPKILYVKNTNEQLDRVLQEKMLLENTARFDQLLSFQWRPRKKIAQYKEQIRLLDEKAKMITLEAQNDLLEILTSYSSFFKLFVNDYECWSSKESRLFMETFEKKCNDENLSEIYIRIFKLFSDQLSKEPSTLLYFLQEALRHITSEKVDEIVDNAKSHLSFQEYERFVSFEEMVYYFRNRHKKSFI